MNDPKTFVPYADKAVADLTIYEKLNKARYVGRVGYYTMDSSAFAFNADAVALIEGMPVGTGSAQIMKAYNSGWTDSANIEAAAALKSIPAY